MLKEKSKKNIILVESDVSPIIRNDISLPTPILKKLRKHQTSLGEHPSFPPEDEHQFDFKIVNKRFKELYNDLQLLDDIDINNENELKNTLSKLITQCQKTEEPIKEQLELLCFNLVNTLFNIPENTVNFSCNIVSNIDPSGKRLTPEETDEIEFEGIEEIEGLNEEVYKRRLINALIQGASLFYSSQIEQYVSEVYKLNSKLPEIYKKIFLINNYLMFLSDDKISLKTPQIAGNVDVHLGNDIILTDIKSEAIIFPILLNESIKGFMELFASHGLPKDLNKALYVIKKADFLLAEPWDMRLGYDLWKILFEQLPNKETDLIPLFFIELISLNAKEFHLLMKEIFCKTKRGKERIIEIYEDIENALKNDDFEDFLSKQNLNTAPIMDDYFSIDELLSIQN